MIGFKEFLDTDEEAKTVVWKTDKQKYGSVGATKKKRERKKAYKKDKQKIKRKAKLYRKKIKRRGGKNLSNVKVKKKGPGGPVRSKSDKKKK